METKRRDILMTHAAAGADGAILEERIADPQAEIAQIRQISLWFGYS